MTLYVAALQYCASDNAAATFAHIEPLIAKAAQTAELICLPKRPVFWRQAARNWRTSRMGR